MVPLNRNPQHGENIQYCKHHAIARSSSILQQPLHRSHNSQRYSTISVSVICISSSLYTNYTSSTDFFRSPYDFCWTSLSTRKRSEQPCAVPARPALLTPVTRTFPFIGIPISRCDWSGLWVHSKPFHFLSAQFW